MALRTSLFERGLFFFVVAGFAMIKVSLGSDEKSAGRAAASTASLCFQDPPGSTACETMG
jgi:hypothetical protein